MRRAGNIPATQKAATDDGVVWLQINSGAAGKQGDLDDAAVKVWQEKNKVAATAYLRDRDGAVGKSYAGQDDAPDLRDQRGRHAGLQRCDRQQALD